MVPINCILIVLYTAWLFCIRTLFETHLRSWGDVDVSNSNFSLEIISFCWTYTHSDNGCPFFPDIQRGDEGSELNWNGPRHLYLNFTVVYAFIEWLPLPPRRIQRSVRMRATESNFGSETTSINCIFQLYWITYAFFRQELPPLWKYS